MSAVLTTEPRELISSITYSYWVAAHNKILFAWQRKDFVPSGSANDGGKLQLTIGAAHGIDTDDTVYLHDDNYADGLYDVDSVGATTITLDL